MWTPTSAYTQLSSLSTDLSSVPPLHKSAKMDGKWKLFTELCRTKCIFCKRSTKHYEYSKEELEKLEHIDWLDFYLESLLVEHQVPIIANLYVTPERTQIFWPFFADDNNKWWQSRQQNPTFVSLLIQKQSGKTSLETIPLYINLTGDHVNEAEMPVAIINRKISQIWCSNESKILVTPSFLAHLTQRVMWGIAITWRPSSVR